MPQMGLLSDREVGKAKPQEKRGQNLRLLTLAKTHWIKPLTKGSKDQWKNKQEII